MKVRAYCSSANLGTGFDTVAVALAAAKSQLSSMAHTQKTYHWKKIQLH